jgi:hypothetical protein
MKEEEEDLNELEEEKKEGRGPLNKKNWK